MTDTYTLQRSTEQNDKGITIYYTNVSEADLDRIKELAKGAVEANRDHTKGSVVYEDMFWEFPMLIKHNPQTIQLVNIYTLFATYTG